MRDLSNSETRMITGGMNRSELDSLLGSTIMATTITLLFSQTSGLHRFPNIQLGFAVGGILAPLVCKGILRMID